MERKLPVSSLSFVISSTEIKARFSVSCQPEEHKMLYVRVFQLLRGTMSRHLVTEIKAELGDHGDLGGGSRHLKNSKFKKMNEDPSLLFFFFFFRT